MSDNIPPDDKIVDLKSFKKREGKPDVTSKNKQVMSGFTAGSKISNRGFYPGQKIVCRIVSREQDGYYCFVEDSHPAFLTTDSEYQPGVQVNCQVVSLDRDLVLLTEHSSSDKAVVHNLFYNSKTDQKDDQDTPDTGSSDNCIPFKNRDKDD